MTADRCNKFFNDANYLICIGKMISYDIVLNNKNGFPIHWIWEKSEGNLNNFSFMID